MPKKRRAPSFECAYCGRVAPASDDHVPPASIYSSPPPANAPTVKACVACNTGASLDDEYFRDCILKYHRVYERPEVKSQVGAMLRAAAKLQKRKYIEATLARMEQVTVVTPAGIVLGQRSALRVDARRLEKAATRYVRGLHRFELGRRVPNGASVRVVINPEELHDHNQEVVDLLRPGTLRVVQDRVFHYSWVTAADQPDTSVWLMVFFDHYPVLGFVTVPAARSEVA